MLNQEKTGKYIAEKRKQLGMTQKQLAEQVGITDKAVSKWERGKSIPDSMVMEELCRILRISINEFFSGEDIQEEYYPDRAEENIRVLLKENNVQKRRSKITILCLAAGFFVALVGLYAAVSVYVHRLNDIIIFIDIPSLLFILGIVSAILFLSGAAADFIKAFAVCFGKAEADGRQIRRSVRAVKMTLILTLLAGLFIFVGQMIMMLSMTLDWEYMSKSLSVFLVAVWYSLLLDLLLMPVLFCLQKEV